MRGRTVSIKVRFEDFSTVTRSATLAMPTDMSRAVYATAQELFDRVRASSAGGQRMRLLGVRLEGLVPAGEVVEQLELGCRRSAARLAGGRGRDRSGGREVRIGGGPAGCAAGTIRKGRFRHTMRMKVRGDLRSR